MNVRRTYLAEKPDTVELESPRLVSDDLRWGGWCCLAVLPRERRRRWSLWRRFWWFLLVVDRVVVVDWSTCERVTT